MCMVKLPTSLHLFLASWSTVSRQIMAGSTSMWYEQEILCQKRLRRWMSDCFAGNLTLNRSLTLINAISTWQWSTRLLSSSIRWIEIYSGLSESIKNTLIWMMCLFNLTILIFSTESTELTDLTDLTNWKGFRLGRHSTTSIVTVFTRYCHVLMMRPSWPTCCFFKLYLYESWEAMVERGTRFDSKTYGRHCLSVVISTT